MALNTSFFYFIILWKGHADVMVDGPLGLEGSSAFRRGRDRDRDRDRGLGGAFQYSRRGLRLRRRGAYGIHRVSGPRCQGLCRKVASLRSRGRRLAVRTAMDHPIGALPRTPFPASRDVPSRGNERYEGKNSESYTSRTISAFTPFGGWRHHLPPASRGIIKLRYAVSDL